MRTYTATITLSLAPFTARNVEDADRIINGYVDILANAQATDQALNGAEITWPSVDWHYEHVGGER